MNKIEALHRKIADLDEKRLKTVKHTRDLLLELLSLRFSNVKFSKDDILVNEYLEGVFSHDEHFHYVFQGCNYRICLQLFTIAGFMFRTIDKAPIQTAGWYTCSDLDLFYNTEITAKPLAYAEIYTFLCDIEQLLRQRYDKKKLTRNRPVDIFSHDDYQQLGAKYEHHNY